MANVGVAGAECKSAPAKRGIADDSPERFVLHVCEKIAAWSWKLKTVRSNRRGEGRYTKLALFCCG